MPETCRFFGIVIAMHFNDHEPPHFHARYGGKVARVAIGSLTVLSGSLPPRVQGLVTESGNGGRHVPRVTCLSRFSSRAARSGSRILGAWRVIRCAS
jgi:hypothetical protein